MSLRSRVSPLCDRAAVPLDSAVQNEWRLHSRLEYQLQTGVGERNQSGVVIIIITMCCEQSGCRLLPLGGGLPAGLRIYGNPRRLSDPWTGVNSILILL